MTCVVRVGRTEQRERGAREGQSAFQRVNRRARRQVVFEKRVGRAGRVGAGRVGGDALVNLRQHASAENAHARVQVGGAGRRARADVIVPA